MKKSLKIGGVLLALFLLGFIYFRFFFVFGHGVEAGTLNYFTKKGYIFKTHEGRIVQRGYRGKDGSLESNEFRFSVSNEGIVDQLEQSSGKEVQLRYKEYFATVPWRGASKYVVYEVMSVAEGKDDEGVPLE
ncbi:MAG: hypothetical protein LAT68_08545 [Cyclobacteriaceae bacterium]|nr:hypothetical protein [Cyclobacteriaceae bacterium]MCH8516365.1 hypothetical protein [Cyclobacteriaceae bacterium]